MSTYVCDTIQHSTQHTTNSTPNNKQILINSPTSMEITCSKRGYNCKELNRKSY